LRHFESLVYSSANRCVNWDRTIRPSIFRSCSIADLVISLPCFSPLDVDTLLKSSLDVVSCEHGLIHSEGQLSSSGLSIFFLFLCFFCLPFWLGLQTLRGAVLSIAQPGQGGYADGSMLTTRFFTRLSKVGHALNRPLHQSSHKPLASCDVLAKPTSPRIPAWDSEIRTQTRGVQDGPPAVGSTNKILYVSVDSSLVCLWILNDANT
jgi:hypothetical protein